jgi:hypothetical protein
MTAAASAEVTFSGGPDWVETNQTYLVAALAEVSAALARHVGQPRTEPAAPPDTAGLAAPPALEVVCAAFRLSPFERAVLLLCAGIELDSTFASLCAEAAASPGSTAPTFGLALVALPGAHWSALTPEGPLRWWRLVEVSGHGALTAASLRIDEYVLHFLTGLPGADPKLTGIVAPAPLGTRTTPGQETAAHALADLWGSSGGPLPLLTGAGRITRVAVAVHAAQDLGLRLSLVDPAVIPTDPAARDDLARLLERESVLGTAAFLVDCSDDVVWAGVEAVTSLTGARIAVSAEHPPPPGRRGGLVIHVPRPAPSEQRDLWREYVGTDLPVESLVAAFDLDAASIQMAARTGGDDVEALWSACRAIDRPQLAAHAQRVESAATWQDLVLPPAQRQALELLTAHARHRVMVYDDWGMRMGRSTGLGSTAMFGGPSGTGKTFAAEVVANDLGLDLYRVDLSAVVSKYIGETEKNLRRVFDAADHGAAVLLFDEADALFGKRTEIRDSHDRYANVEVSYLLQRMEAYRGMAILTTNMVEAVDTAFLRRLRFVVSFPFPDEEMRLQLWRQAFSAGTPSDGLDFEALAKLDLAGGTIRNVAVNAAFLAAEAEEPVRMSHVILAARIESGKLGQPLASLRWVAGS